MLKLLKFILKANYFLDNKLLTDEKPEHKTIKLRWNTLTSCLIKNVAVMIIFRKEHFFNLVFKIFCFFNINFIKNVNISRNILQKMLPVYRFNILLVFVLTKTFSDKTWIQTTICWFQAMKSTPVKILLLLLYGSNSETCFNTLLPDHEYTPICIAVNFYISFCLFF